MEHLCYEVGFTIFYTSFCGFTEPVEMVAALPGNAYVAYSTQPINTDFAPVCIICARYMNSDMGNNKYLLYIH